VAERCKYCGRFMSRVDFGAEFGSEWVCTSLFFNHMVADPEHWSAGSLDEAIRVAKARAGLDPDALAQPIDFLDHLDAEWRQPFWERQVATTLNAALPREAGRA
jgi:hypothetical protein